MTLEKYIRQSQSVFKRLFTGRTVKDWCTELKLFNVAYIMRCLQVSNINREIVLIQADWPVD